MRVRINLVFLILLSLGVSVNAFDNQRKGFVVGIGFGYAPSMTSRWEHQEESVEFDMTGVAAHVMLGYGFDERNVLVVHRALAGEATADDADSCSGLVQGMGHGLTYYHYFRDLEQHSPFLALGIGRHFQNIREADVGTGLLLGGGVELTRRWQVGLYFIRGWTESFGIDFHSKTLMLLATAIWK